MIRLKSLLKEQVQLTAQQEAWLDKCTNSPESRLARKWKIDTAGFIYVDGNFDTSRGYDGAGAGQDTLRGVKIKEVTGWCSLNDLKSLIGAPVKVGGACWISRCDVLTLQNAPQSVGGDFKVQICDLLKSLEGAPKTVGGNFITESNATKFTEAEIRAVSNVTGNVIIN
jgi:hypothetical protein